MLLAWKRNTMSSQVELAVRIGHARQVASTLESTDAPLIYVGAARRSGPYASMRYNLCVPRDRIGYVLDEFYLPHRGGPAKVERHEFATLELLAHFFYGYDVHMCEDRSCVGYPMHQ